MLESATPVSSRATAIVRPDWSISRRSFVRRCAMVAAATGLPSWFVERQLAAAETTPGLPSANDRPGIALVGCGGMGKVDAGNAANFGDIVALADVDASHLAEAREQFTKDGKVPATFGDFRELMAHPDVDLIINGTPDHWHTLVNLAALKAGKDVYSEKPLTLTIDEGRRLVQAVRSSGIVLQTGTQQRSSQRFRLVSELVRNERIGALKKVNVWLPAGLKGGPFAPADVPEGLNWDFWQGQAPATAYVPERCHAKFRFWYDYSGGTMTDWGAHHIDIAGWAIGLVAPVRVEAQVETPLIAGGFTAFADYVVRYTYGNGVELEVRTTPADNIYGAVVDPDGQRNGIRFEGTDGWLWVNRKELKASDPELLRAPLPEGSVKLPVSRDHMGNFVECTRTRGLPICEVEVGHRSASMCHLGAIALRTGLKLTWDAAAERFVGDGADVANTYLAREMRAPYDYSFGS